MNELKIFVIATTGGVFLQTMDPLPSMVSGQSPGDLLVRMGISIVGGIISTLAYRAIQHIPWRKRRREKKQIIEVKQLKYTNNGKI